MRSASSVRTSFEGDRLSAASRRPSLIASTRLQNAEAMFRSWVAATSVTPRSVQLAQHALNRQLMLQIKKHRRLIEQQHPGLLRQRAGQDNELPLAATQGAERPVGEMISRQARARDRLDHDRAPSRRRLHPDAGGAPSARPRVPYGNAICVCCGTYATRLAIARRFHWCSGAPWK